MKKAHRNLFQNTKLRNIIIMIAIISLGGGAVTALTARSSRADTKWSQSADDDTSGSYTELDSTDNVGKIWTDKSVSAGDDDNFNVTLSALSSASSLTSTKSQPYDIVLVLDTSGSMDYPFEENPQYEAVNKGAKGTYRGHKNTFANLDESETYMIYPNDIGYKKYIPIRYFNTSVYTGWASTYGVSYDYYSQKYYAFDNQDDSTFYRVTNSTEGTRFSALKDAATDFVKTIDQNNSGLSDAEKTRISIVKFAGNETSSEGNDMYLGSARSSTQGYYYPLVNYAQVVNDYTSSLDTLTANIDALQAGGMTRSDYALEKANEEVAKARTDAKKIVVFFSDGEPTTEIDYEAKVASPAVEYAKTIKDSGATIYCIGATEDSDPSADPTSASTSNMNKFMNAVSSKYPDASVTTTNRYTFGTGVDGQFFYPAKTAGEMAEAFQSILEKLESGTGYPVETTTEDAAKDGYVTFTDQLGDYMEVKDFTKLDFGNGKTFTNPEKTQTTSEGKTVTTYKFSGTATTNLNTEGSDVSNIIVTVESSGDTAQAGDIVTVKVPAALLPVEYFDIDLTKMTGEKKAASPLKMTYSVGLKNQYKTEMEEGNFSNISTAYQSANTTDGKLNFYTNRYEKGKAEGLTTAVYDPSSNNPYYTFTEATTLYTDPEGTTKATGSSFNPGRSYYFKHTYYTIDNSGKVTETTEVEELVSDEIQKLYQDGKIKENSEDNTWYIEKGADYTGKLETGKKKDANTTGTASDVISSDMSDGGIVTDSLGNNGKINIPVPGKLSVTKELDVPAGYSDQSDKEFAFQVYVKGATGEHAVTVTDASGNTVSGAITKVTFDTSYNATFTLKGGQTATIANLPQGADYTVTETALPKGFTNSKKTGDMGTIVSGQTGSATFTNTYSVTPEEKTVNVKGIKEITGRKFEEGDTFTFNISGSYSGKATAPDPIPLPSNFEDGSYTFQVDDSLVGQDSGSFDFGTITFSVPGTYTYTVSENVPADDKRIAGITYSRASYTITYTVSDDGMGGLTVSDPVVKMTRDDAGEQQDKTTTEVKFTNGFSAEDIHSRILAKKSYTDHTGTKPLTKGMFHFALKPLGTDGKGTGADTQPMPETGTQGSGADRVSYAVNESSGEILFGTFLFTQDDLGKTYYYSVAEQIDDPSTTEVETAEKGMTYDTTTKGTTVYKFTVTISKNNQGVLQTQYVILDGPKDANGNLLFTNSYQAEDDRLSLTGSKTLTGRDMADGETFSFKLEPADTETSTAVTKGWITLPSGTSVSVSGGKNGESESFSFADITFKKKGTYKFNISETVPASAGNGMTYDLHVCTVTVNVEDNGGRLVATPDYGTYSGKPANQFNNTYTASMTYPGINISKTLNGRSLSANEFAYTISGTDSESVTAEQAEAKLTAADQNFQNPAAADDGKESVWQKLSSITFTQDDAGKTYTYKVGETRGTLGGVTYDGTVYTVAIHVIDNQDGTLKTETTVTGGNYSQTVTNTSKELSATQELAKVPFTNSYEATGKISPAVEKTIAGRDWKTDDTFTFRLEPDNDAAKSGVRDGTVVMPEGYSEASGSSAEITASTMDHTAQFGDITFKKPGTYSFKVTETAPADDDLEVSGTQTRGLTYDANAQSLTVVVKDENHNGTLTVTCAPSDQTVSFTNTYNPKPVTSSFTGTKTMSGRDLQSGDTFTFRIVGAYSGAATNVDVPMPANAKIVSVSDAGVKTGTWTWNYAEGTTGNSFVLDPGQFTFSAPGTYTYQISENSGDLPGITYSDAVYTYTVVVTDTDQTGQLSASGTLKDASGQTVGSADFTNKAADEIDVELKARKNYSDTTGQKPLYDSVNHTDGEKFSFTLKPTGDNAADAPMPEGSSGTGADRTCTVFNNGVQIALGKLHIAQKDVGKVYTYEVSEVIPEGATKNSDGKYTLNGMIYDDTVHKVKVTVTQNASTKEISADVQYDDSSSEPSFTNKYEPAPADVTVEGTKTLNGRDMKSGDEFDFTLKAVDNATTAAVNAGDITSEASAPYDAAVTGSASGPKNGAETKFYFGGKENGLRFSKPGTYQFTMAETKGSIAGVSYDSHKCTVTVTVTDKGDGTLQAEVSYSENNGADGNKFVNTYTAEPDSIPVSVTKVLTGRTPGLQDKEFEFSIKVNNSSATSGDGWKIQAVDGTADGRTKNNADGKADFGNIEFSKTGTYTVEVKEIVPDPADPMITYDTHSYTFQVTVSDDQNGNLKATTSNVKGSTIFTNTFTPGENTKSVSEADSSGNIRITDADGDMVSAGDILHYTINWVNDAVDASGKSAAATVTITDPVPAGTEFVQASEGGTNQNGTVTWTIQAAAGQKGTVTFDVKVTDAALDNVDHSIRNTGTVTINDNPKTTNEVRNSVPEKEVRDASGADINNTAVKVGDILTYRIYYANVEKDPVDITITDTIPAGTKYVDGGTLSGNAVTWNLTDVKANTTGYVSFRVQVTEDAVEKIDNTATLKIGNDYDTTNTTHNTLKTGDLSFDKKVQLSVPQSTNIDNTKEFEFTVTFRDATGAELQKAYSYSGTSDGNTVISGTIKSGGTIKLKNNGKVTIKGLPAGSSWKITEAAGDGYVADRSEHSGVIPENSATEVTYNNTYKLKNPSIPLKALKQLEGRTLTEGEFTFNADVQREADALSSTDENGSAVTNEGWYLASTDGSYDHQTKNAADGSVNFGNLYFTKVGNYTVTVTELVPDPKAPFVTYDQHSYTFHVKVTDDKKGNLVLTPDSSYIEEGNSGSAVFRNTYKPDDNTKTVEKEIDGVKTNVDGKMVGVGDTLTYTVNWVNDAVSDKGVAQKADITVTDQIPEGTSYVQNSANPSASLSTDGRTLTWSLGEQAAGATGKVTFQVKVDESAVSNEDNTIRNSASIKVGDHDPKTTNEVTNTVPEKTVEDLTRQIEDADGHMVGIGDTLKYTVSFTNTADDAADVTIQDPVPAGTKFAKNDTADSVKIGDKDCTVTFTAPENNSGVAQWVIHSVPKGASGSVSFEVTVDESAAKLEGSRVDNVATVKINGDPEISTNTTTNDVPQKSVDAQVGNTKITDADGDLVGIGDTLTYHISWSNASDSEETVTVKDAVPEGTTFVGNSAVVSEGTAGTPEITQPEDGAEAGSAITWELGRQPAGSKGSVTFQVKVDKSVLEIDDLTVRNDATVKINGDPEITTNEVDNPVPEKSVEDVTKNIKDADGKTVQVGDILEYSIKFINTQKDADGNYTAVKAVITDAVPAGTEYVSADNGGQLKTSSSGSKYVEWNLDIPANSSRKVSFRAKVTEAALTLGSGTDDAADDGVFANTAGVKLGDRPEVTTNTVTNNVRTGDLVIRKTVNAVEGQTATDSEFTFQVTLVDASGNALTGSYPVSGTYDADGTDYQTKSGKTTVKSGDQIKIKAGGKVTIKGLPEGSGWIVREMSIPAGFSPKKNPLEGRIPEDSEASSSFVNTYDTENADVPVVVKKIMEGRDLTKGEFSFTMNVKPKDADTPSDGWTITPAGGVESDAGATEATAKNAVDTDSGHTGDVNFGKITFTKPGKYIITIRENVPDDEHKLPFVTYDEAVRSFQVEVYDDGGALAYYLEDENGNHNFDILSTINFTNRYHPDDNTKTVADTTLNIQDADGKQVQIGDTLHYTIHWVNDAIGSDGKSSDAKVTVTDTVPEGTKLVESEDSPSDSGKVSDDKKKITWTIDAKAGESGDVSFDVKVDDSIKEYAYQIENAASVKIGDDEKTTNTVRNTVPHKEVSNVTHSITDAEGTILGLGDTVRYTVYWKNTETDESGNPAAATVKISDVLPGGTTFVSADNGGKFTANSNYDASLQNSDDQSKLSKGTVNWEFQAEAGASGSVTFDVTVDENAYLVLRHNIVDNTAKVQIGNSPEVSTNTTHNMVPEKLEVKGSEATVNLVNENSGELVGVGDIITYQILYMNRDETEAQMYATDTVPDGTEYVKDSAKVYYYTPSGAKELEGSTADVSDGKNITWSAKVPGGAAGYAAFQVKVTEDAYKLGSDTETTDDDNIIQNTAQVKIGNSPSVSTNTTENPVPEKTVSTLDENGGIAIEDADGKLIGIGDTIRYTVSWKNTDPAEDGADITITDATPDGTVYAGGASVNPADASQITNSDITAPEEGGTGALQWAFHAAKGASGTVTFDVTVTEDVKNFANKVDNTAKVKIGDSAEVSTNTVHNPVPVKTVTADDHIAQSDGVTLTDLNGHLVGVGDTLTYTVSWENGESGKARVTVKDYVPAGTTYAGGAKAFDQDGKEITDDINIRVQKDADGRQFITWTLYERESGAKGTVSFQTKVDSSIFKLANPVAENQASVQIGDDPAVDTNKTENPTPLKDVDIDPADENEPTVTSADGQIVGIGDTLHYTVSWKNTGLSDSAYTKITVTDKIPDGTRYTENTAKVNPADGVKIFTDDEGTEGTPSPEVNNGTIKWIFYVKKNAEGTVSFDVTVTEDALGLPARTIDNTAYVRLDDDDAMSTNTTHNPVPTKTESATTGNVTIQDADGKTVGIGDTLTYHINWVNTQTEKAAVTVTDQVPAGTAYVEGSANSGGSYDAATGIVTWNLGEQEAGAKGTVSFQVTVEESVKNNTPKDTVENRATVTIGDHSAVTNKVTNTVPEKTVSREDASGATTEINGQVVGVGDELTYTVSYRNTESGKSDVIITDAVPAGTGYVKDSADHDGSYDEATNTIRWTLRDVEPGKSGTVSFKVKVTDEALTESVVENEAEVQIGKNNPAVKTNKTVNPIPMKEVQDQDGNDIDGDLVGVGDKLHYVIHYKNSEKDPATVVITDDIPAGTAYVGGSAKADNEGVTATIGQPEDQAPSGTVKWTIENVASDGEGTVSFDVTVTEGAFEQPDYTVKNTAAVQVGDNPAVKTNTVTNSVPEKTVDVTGGSGDNQTTIRDANGRLVGVGDILTYKVEWKNTDDSRANVAVTDTIPAGTEYVENSAKVFDAEGREMTDDFSIENQNGKLTWKMYYQPSGASGTAVFQVKVTEAAFDLEPAAVRNQASVRIGNHPEIRTNPVENPVPEKDVSSQHADNPVVEDADGKPVQIGDVLTYTVHWKNESADADGNPAKAKVVVTDPVPAGTVYVDGSAKAYKDGDTNPISGADGILKDGTITWTIDQAPENSSGTVTFRVKVDESVLEIEGRRIENTATVQIGDNPAVSTNTTENPVPGKDVTRTYDSNKTVIHADGKTVGIGDHLVYSVSWSNGTGKTADVVIQDTIPAGTEIIPNAIDNNGQYDAATRTITWTLKGKPDGAYGQVTFLVSVTKDALNLPNNTIENEATVAIDNQSSVTNKVTNTVPEKTVANVTKKIQDADGKLASVGDILTYTVEWRNGGDESADVTIRDSVPKGTEYVDGSADSGGQEKDGKVVWTIRNAGPGATGKVSFRVKITEEALKLAKNTVENTATVQLNDDPAAGTNTVTNPVPEKEVENTTKNIKDANGREISVGDILTYTIHYTNPESEAAKVTITDPVPAGTEYVEDSAGEGGSFADGKVTWTLENVEPGASGTVSFQVKVTEEAFTEAKGSVANTATVQIGDNPAVDTNTVTNGLPKKEVLDGEGNDIDGQLVKVGDELTYVVHYTNSKNSEAKVVVTDTIPVGTGYVRDSAEGKGAKITGPDKNGKLTWTIDKVDAGASGTVSFKVTVTRDAYKNEDNLVENTGKVKIGDNPEVDTNTVTNGVPEKEVRDGNNKEADGQGVAVGDVLNYMVTYTNPQATASDVIITDAIPEGTEYVDGSADHDGALSADGKSVEWTIADVGSGKSGTVSFQVRVTDAAAAKGEADNTAQVKIGPDGPAVDTNTVTNPVPYKEVHDDEDQDINGTLVKVGDELTYVVYYRNSDSKTADVKVYDTIPDGTDYVDGSAAFDGTVDKASAIAGPDSGDMLTWTIKNVPGETSGSVRFKVRVNEEVYEHNNIVTNTGRVQVGDNPVVETNTVTNGVPEKEVTGSAGTDMNGGTVTVGEELTYTVHYVNPESTAAKVTVTDTIPKGTEYAEGSAAGEGASVTGPDANGKITWTIDSVEPGASGTVTFKVVVTGDAVKAGKADNTAQVQIGDNPAVDTNTVTTKVTAGGLEISKEVGKADDSLEPDPDAEFTFRVTFSKAGKELTGSYRFSGRKDAEEEYTGTVRSGDKITLRAGGSVVIADLPDGTEWTVKEVKVPAGYTPEKDTMTGTIRTDAEEGAKAAFTNTYRAAGKAVIELEKEVKGRDWTKDDYFNFQIQALTEGAPMPGSTTVKVTKPEKGNKASFRFGEITYTKPGTYVYKVTEEDAGKLYDGIRYDDNEAEVTVTVTDGGKGELKTAVAVTKGNATFVNTYEPGEVDFDAIAGLQIVKNMTGRDITDGAFRFTLKGTDEASAKKLSGEEALSYQTYAAEMDSSTLQANETVAAPTGLVFRAADAGKTFSYQVTEAIPDGAKNNGNGTWTLNGVTYDSAVHTLTFTVSEDGKGTVYADVNADGSTFTISSNDKEASHSKVSYTFNNSYHTNSETVEIRAAKEMTGQDLVDNEFGFRVTVPNKDRTENVVVATGTNAADGTVSLSPITYTQESLRAENALGYNQRTVDGSKVTYTYHYTVSEDAVSADYGITQEKSSFSVRVDVTDDGEGNLKANVTYPEDATNGVLVFRNSYKSNEVSIDLKGRKDLVNTSESAAPDITGKYNFTVSADAGTPMPAVTSVNGPADATGTVDFGEITYTLENVFGAEEGQPGIPRSKTFTYTITESGQVANVGNDANAKTVTVTVTDDGAGMLTASVGGQNNGSFTFTNTYTGPNPVTGNFTVKKNVTINGGNYTMEANEFIFQMTDGSGNVVSSGTNDAAGNVTMSRMTFTKEGEYTYTLREAAGSEKGITYDTTVYNVTASVEKDANDNLQLTWKFNTTDGEVPTFNNVYTPDSTPATADLRAMKEFLSMIRELKGDDFTFQLLDSNGTVIQTAKNTASGLISFDTISYAEEGTWEYIIKEVIPSTDDDPNQDGIQQNGITYDETMHTVNVEVIRNEITDRLQATVTYDGGSAAVPIFTNHDNTYTPSTPGDTPTPTPTPTPSDNTPSITTRITNNGYTPRYRPNTTVSNPPAASGTAPVKTGDDSNVSMYAIILALCGIGIAVFAIRRRRQNNR
ncbi:MAG: Spy0128 family protein [Bilifractor sp.]|jgi:pilin isopeptide linkage protein/fimbrial isopeptide formation D2 family protein/uncharacterized repeat protein (TIGR01451 family)